MLYTPEKPQIYALQTLQLIVATGLIVFFGICPRAVRTSVELACNGICHVGELLLLLLKVFRCCSGCIFLEPLCGLFDSVDELRRWVSRVMLSFVRWQDLRSPCHPHQFYLRVLLRHSPGSSS